MLAVPHLGPLPAPIESPKPKREKLLTPVELSEWLGCSAAWVRDHSSRAKPRLPVTRLGKLLRYRVSDIEEFLRQQGIAA